MRGLLAPRALGDSVPARRPTFASRHETAALIGLPLTSQCTKLAWSHYVITFGNPC
jgi:hypothetical protein